MANKTSAISRSSSLDALVPILLRQQPELLPFFLLESNHHLSNIAAQAAYRRLDLIFETGVAVHNALTLKLASVLSNQRYADYVQELYVSHSTRAGPGCSSQTPTEAQSQGWSLAASIIRACPKLVTLDWKAAFGIGGEVWDSISHSIHLHNLRILQPATHVTQQDVKTPRVTVRRGSDSNCERPWELGDVWNGLQELKVSGLSATGTKVLASHLRQLAERPQQPALESIGINTTFLDGSLCSAMSNIGGHGHLRRLELSTSGSKLSTEAFVGLVESCTGLQELILKDVQGRLDRDVWAKIEYPKGLRKLVVEISEDGQHHSWTHTHLTSIHQAPLSKLTHFAVHRSVPPLATLPLLPTLVSLSVPEVSDFCHPKSVPTELIASLAAHGSSLCYLSLDWWRCSPSDVEQLARGCGKLQTLQLMLDCPMSKLLTLATALSNLHELIRLHISISAENARRLNNDIITGASRGSPVKTPTSRTPIENDDLPPELTMVLHALDPTVPLVKDIRKLVRRLPRLREINWEGRGGKGTWFVARTDDRKGGNDIWFEHAVIRTLDIWHEAQGKPPVWDFPEEVLSMSQVDGFESSDAMGNEHSPSSTLLSTPLSRSGSTPALDAMVKPVPKSPNPKKTPRRMSLPHDTIKPSLPLGLGLNVSGRSSTTKQQTASKPSTKQVLPVAVQGFAESSPKKIVTANGWRVAGTPNKKPRAKETHKKPC